MRQLDRKEWLDAMRNRIGVRKYTAMYSSWAGGVVTDVDLMMIPMDDHLVHRGDGIFEAVAFSGDLFFEMEAHVDRLYRSAEMIGLKMPHPKQKLTEICREVVAIAKLDRGILRIFVSRGPGDFSPNPYSTVGAQLYVVVMADPPARPALYEKGGSLMISKVPIKPGPFAQVKSCNYLPNVMTKKDSVDKGVDFAVNVNENGDLAEGPTENLMLLNSKRELVCPPFDYTLRGTTLLRVLEVAKKLEGELEIKVVGPKTISLAEIKSAKEIMMVGTTLGVCPITQLEGQSVADGKVGGVAKRLHTEIQKLMGR